MSLAHYGALDLDPKPGHSCCVPGIHKFRERRAKRENSQATQINRTDVPTSFITAMTTQTGLRRKVCSNPGAD